MKKKNILSCCLIIWMIVILKSTVISRGDQRFDILSRIRHQKKERGCLSVERHNSGSWTMIDELCRDVIGCETRTFIAGKKNQMSQNSRLNVVPMSIISEDKSRSERPYRRILIPTFSCLSFCSFKLSSRFFVSYQTEENVCIFLKLIKQSPGMKLTVSSGEFVRT